MYPYPPRRTHDDEPTMHDLRGVPARQRPPVEAALLDEPTSEVPVIRPAVRTAATVGVSIPEARVTTEPAGDPAPAAADRRDDPEAAAESGPEPAADEVAGPEPAADEVAGPSLHTDADTPDAYEEEPDSVDADPVDAPADSVSSEPAAPEAAQPDTDWPPAPAEIGAPDASAPVDATANETTEPSVPDTETEPSLHTSDPYAPAGTVADVSVRPLATPPVSSAFDEPVAAAPSEEVAEPGNEPAVAAPSEEVAELAEEPAAEEAIAEAEPAPSAPPALPARVAGHVPPAPIAIWADGGADRFREQWRDLQVQFFDDPAEAVTGAKALVTDAVQELADTLLAAQDGLDPFEQGVPADTEAMRVAMRRYQEFLERVLAL